MSSRINFIRSQPALTLILSIALVVSVSCNVWLSYKQISLTRSSPEQQTKAIITELEKTTNLPSGDPAILTVVDKTRLSNKVIADAVENGDKILLYQQAKKLIVYRPATHKLVTIFNLDSNLGGSTSVAQPGTKAITR